MPDSYAFVIVPHDLSGDMLDDHEAIQLVKRDLRKKYPESTNYRGVAEKAGTALFVEGAALVGGAASSAVTVGAVDAAAATRAGWALKSTHQHLEALKKLLDMSDDGCQCEIVDGVMKGKTGENAEVVDFKNRVCKVALAFAISQKTRKKTKVAKDAAVASTPLPVVGPVYRGIIGGARFLQSKGHALGKTLLGDAGVLREAHARNIWYGAKKGCPRAKAIGKELVGTTAWEPIGSNNWEKLADKMSPG